MDSASKVVGVLVGGAFGEALTSNRGRPGPASQLSLFTAEGLIRSAQTWEETGRGSRLGGVHRALRRWLAAQVDGITEADTDQFDGWLRTQVSACDRRGADAATLVALSTAHLGRVERQWNPARSAHPVTRSALAGVASDDPLHTGVELARLTHTHPQTGWAGGAMALMVAALAEGADLDEAVDLTAETLRHMAGAEPLARHLAAWRNIRIGASLEPLRRASQALPTAVALVGTSGILTLRDRSLVTSIPRTAPGCLVPMLAGQLVGAALGPSWIPEEWLRHTEEVPVLVAVAEDLHRRCALGQSVATDRYPLERPLTEPVAVARARIPRRGQLSPSASAA